MDIEFLEYGIVHVVIDTVGIYFDRRRRLVAFTHPTNATKFYIKNDTPKSVIDVLNRGRSENFPTYLSSEEFHKMANSFKVVTGD